MTTNIFATFETMSRQEREQVQAQLLTQYKQLKRNEADKYAEFANAETGTEERHAKFDQWQNAADQLTIFLQFAENIGIGAETWQTLTDKQ